MLKLVLKKCINYYIFWALPTFAFCRQYSTDYKLETYLKIARLYLEDDDAVQAEAYINRASLLQAETKNEELQIHYKVSSLGESVGALCECLEKFLSISTYSKTCHVWTLWSVDTFHIQTLLVLTDWFLAQNNF